MASSTQLKSAIADMPTISAKIRALAEHGLERSAIARMLGIRYQHVRNVLEGDKVRRTKVEQVDGAVPAIGAGLSVRVRVGPDGRLVVPAAFRDKLGLKEGDVLFARLENGEIHLLTPKAAARRAQAVIRQFVPEGVSLVDELIEDRRREVERENG